jgi:tetratricopeptide (TPR) repeat protein
LDGFVLSHAREFNLWVDAVRADLIEKYRSVGRRYISELEAKCEWARLLRATETYSREIRLDSLVAEAEIRALLMLHRLDDAHARCKYYSQIAEQLGDDSDATWIRQLGQRVQQFGGANDELETKNEHGAQLRFVGRTSEIVALRTVWRAAKHGNGSAVVLVGEAGIGKSRITEQLTRLVVLQGGRAMVGRCSRLERRIPYAGITDTLREGLRVTDLAGLEHHWLAPLADFLPEACNDRDATVVPGETEWSQRKLFESIAHILSRIGSRTPLLFIVDDVHWADEATIGLLSYLRRRLGNQRILLLAVARAEDVDQNLPLAELLEANGDDGWVQLEVGELDPNATEELIFMFEKRHGNLLTPPQRSELLRRTGGRPFFVLEALHQIMEQRSTPGNGASGARRQLLPPTVSARLQDQIRSRLAALSPEAVAAAYAIATADRHATAHVITDATGSALGVTLRAFSELAQRRLISEDGRMVRFSHELLRQAVYAAIPPTTRSALHRAIGRTLVSEQEAHPGSIADHLFEGGDWNAAYDYAVRAASASMRACAYEHARYYWQLALRSAPTPSDWQKAAKAYGCFLIDIACTGEALPIFEALAPAYEAQDDSRGLLTVTYVRLAAALAAGSNPAASLVELFQALAQKVEATGQTSRLVQVLGSLAEVAHDAGRQDIVRQLIDVLSGLGARLGRTLDAAECYRLSARLRCVYGEFQLAFEQASRAVSIALSTGTKTAAVECALARAATALMCGDVRVARADLERQSIEACQLGIEAYRVKVAAELGVLFLEICDYEQAKRALEDALTLATNHEKLYVFANLAAVGFESGDHDLAFVATRQMFELNQRIGAQWIVLVREVLLGLVELDRENEPAALAHWERAREELDVKSTVVGDSTYWCILNARILATNDVHGAMEFLSTVIDEGRLSYFAQLRLRLELARLLAKVEPDRAWRIARDVRSEADHAGAPCFSQIAESCVR